MRKRMPPQRSADAGGHRGQRGATEWTSIGRSPQQLSSERARDRATHRQLRAKLNKRTSSVQPILVLSRLQREALLAPPLRYLRSCFIRAILSKRRTSSALAVLMDASASHASDPLGRMDSKRSPWNLRRNMLSNWRNGLARPHFQESTCAVNETLRLTAEMHTCEAC